MTIVVHHRIPRTDLSLGIIVAEGVELGAAPPELERTIDELIARRKLHPRTEHEERVCKLGRDILRNGRYKPTGRGKPANEYLLRAAQEGNFPRVNGPVDANNLVSLSHNVAISVWDLDLAQATEFEFRLGRTGESYVFNQVGQALDLEDLVCGCGIDANSRSQPMVTPIKDSMATKLRATSTRLAGCIYFPSMPEAGLNCQAILSEFSGWLLGCGERVKVASAVCCAGESIFVG